MTKLARDKERLFALGPGGSPERPIVVVSPAEVEARLLAHDDVAQAVVVAANDTDGLEKPVAFVLLSPGAIGDEDALIEFCRAGLPSFKRPRRIVFVTEYPTTSTGKIRRVELRTQAVSIMQGTVP